MLYVGEYATGLTWIAACVSADPSPSRLNGFLATSAGLHMGNVANRSDVITEITAFEHLSVQVQTYATCQLAWLEIKPPYQERQLARRFHMQRRGGMLNDARTFSLYNAE